MFVLLNVSPVIGALLSFLWGGGFLVECLGPGGHRRREFDFVTSEIFRVMPTESTQAINEVI